MAATKTNANLLNAQATTLTSSAQDVSTHYADTVAGWIDQVGTAATAASIQVQLSFDGGNNYISPVTLLATAGTAAGRYPFMFAIDPDATHVKVTYTQQSGGASSSCTAQLASVTGI